MLSYNNRDEGQATQNSYWYSDPAKPRRILEQYRENNEGQSLGKGDEYNATQLRVEYEIVIDEYLVEESQAIHSKYHEVNDSNT